MQPGTRLGPYEVVSRIGAGGMGEVWRARDARLGRDVAIKILPADFAQNAKLKVRFEREARTISQLTHPNICTLFDVGENYIVMELLEGESLASRLARGPLSLTEVMRYGVQLAEALGQAHRQGIVHRDLKPGNVMITKSGAKLLDFGLAKSTAVAAVPGDETIPKPLTEEGQVLGTFQYMAPEQLAGDEPDTRTDIFALGAVLYEMATGKRAFEGKTRTSLVSAIVSGEPRPIRELQPLTPPAFEHVVLKCLEKERDHRWQNASDVAEELRWIGHTGSQSGVIPATTFKRRRDAVFAAIAALFAVAVGILAVMYVRANARAGRLQVTLAKTAVPPQMTFRQVTDDAGVETEPALSPDGKFVAYVSARSGNDDIYLQRIGGTNTLNLTASSPANDSQPAFSRDGQWIAFRSERDGGGIFVMGSTGESVRRVSDFGSNPSWSPDGRELVASSTGLTDWRQRRSTLGELWIIEVNNGRKRRLTSLATDGDAVQPSWSPHGHRIAFWSIGAPGHHNMHLATIPAAGGKAMLLFEGKQHDMSPVWSPDGRYLYFSSDRGGSLNLWRVGIDEVSGETTGDPEPVTVPARTAWPMSIAGDGRTLAYCARESRWNLERVTMAPDGTCIEKPVPVFARTTEMIAPDVSPDGRRITYVANDHVFVARADGRDVLQLTDTPRRETYPAWAPDGKRIAFASNRSGKPEIWMIGADGSGLTQVTSDSTPVFYPRWSRDGSRISTRADEACKAGACIVDMRGPYPLSPRGDVLPAYDAEPGWLVAFHDWSPDGKWLSGGDWLDASHPTRMLVYSFETRTYTKLLDVCPVWECFSRWMPDSRHLLFSDGRRIQMIDRVTGKIREVVDTGSPNDGFLTVTRDGRYVYYVRDSEESDVWVATLN